LGAFLDTVPWSGIVRIRDMMYSVREPFRLDQGDVSFDAPDTVKSAMTRAIAENRTHYLQSTGLPRLRELMAEKMRTRNGIPIGDVDEVLVTNGGIHALFVMFQGLLEPGDEVLLPDPVWPPTAGHVIAAQAKPVFVPLHESLGWRYDLDELKPSTSTRRTIRRAACSRARTSRPLRTSPASGTCGCSPTKRTRTCSSKAST
jgi:aspartate aminotransferase